MDFHAKCTICAFSLAIIVLFTRSFAHGAGGITTNAEYQNFKALHYGENLVLQCNETNPSNELVIKWFKYDKPITSSSGVHPKYEVKDNELIIHRALEDDVANYTCKLVNSKNNNSVVDSADFHVVGKPYVKLPEFITVIEEEKLKLECTVVGSPTPYVEWYIGNETYDQSAGRVKLSPDPVRGVKNALLELEPARMSDRGIINCTAHNVATTFVEPMVATVYVRVKDKYAALWPFLGICAEVIVLCTVIFIYEKKRNKAELEESDTDQSPEQKNTPDHGKDSVRQRK